MQLAREALVTTAGRTQRALHRVAARKPILLSSAKDHFLARSQPKACLLPCSVPGHWGATPEHPRTLIDCSLRQPPALVEDCVPLSRGVGHVFPELLTARFVPCIGMVMARFELMAFQPNSWDTVEGA